MTFAELRRQVNANDSQFFNRESMAFFGDTASNYGVRGPVEVQTYGDEIVQCWELYRRKPVKHGLQSSCFFAVDDYRRVYKKREEEI